MSAFVKPLIAVASLLPMFTLVNNVQASQPQPVGPDTGECRASGVLETSRVLGYCVVGGVKKAWFRNANPTELINLKPLQANRSCDSSFLSQNIMTGTCDQLLGPVLGKVPVFWRVAFPKDEPKRLQPLPLDTGAELRASTLFGNVAGQSITLLGNTAVVWRVEKGGEPIQVSLRNDNCRVAAIADSNADSSTLVALNCPHLLGNPKATIATFNGTKYVMKTLKLPPAATFCDVVGINSKSQAAGTCHYANNFTAATYWSGPDAEAKTLVSTENYSVEVAFLNNNGSAIVKVLVAQNQEVPAFWRTSTADADPLPTPQNFNNCRVDALALSVDTALMTCASENLSIPNTVFSWNPNGGLNSIQPTAGSDEYVGEAISNSALEAVGSFQAGPNIRAFISTLP
ncbi:hypothetical protein H8F23_00270 [Pseudomonas sp. P155]|uniref:Ig-like domain-containing protein n=1 Tax=Pseudomonas neuropathica TaxID=2730425 RepID=A0ABS0BEE2_9PSED|nr:hypothetical protein [Pseudomonas neuropathica]MBF6031677.1 hypothetical protein [Pseudomonas neuropathica]